MDDKKTKELQDKFLTLIEEHLRLSENVEESYNTVVDVLKALVVASATLGATAVLETTKSNEEKDILNRSERFSQLFKNDLLATIIALLKKSGSITNKETNPDKKDIIWH